MGKPRRCLPQPALQRALKKCSPLLSSNPSIPPNELLPLISRNTSPASLRPPPSNHTAAKLRSGLCSGPWEMFKEPLVLPHTLKTVHFGNFNLSACLYHLRISTAWRSSSDKNMWLCPPSQGFECLRRNVTAHAGEIFLVLEGRSQFDIGGLKCLNSCPFTPSSIALSVNNPRQSATFSSFTLKFPAVFFIYEIVMWALWDLP